MENATSWSSEVTARKAITDRKSTRLNSSHSQISYAVFCLKKKNQRDAAMLTVMSLRIQQLVAIITPSTRMLLGPFVPVAFDPFLHGEPSSTTPDLHARIVL